MSRVVENPEVTLRGGMPCLRRFGVPLRCCLDALFHPNSLGVADPELRMRGQTNRGLESLRAFDRGKAAFDRGKRGVIYQLLPYMDICSIVGIDRGKAAFDSGKATFGGGLPESPHSRSPPPSPSRTTGSPRQAPPVRRWFR